MGRTKHEIVQLPNPKTKRWVKIDKTDGRIISHKKSPGCYTGVPIADSVKCDCTHAKSDHYLGGGRCSACGCTWFHPEIQYCKPVQAPREDLSDTRCPECNSRMRFVPRRSYYCSHCKKRYKAVVQLVKVGLVEDKRRGRC